MSGITDLDQLLASMEPELVEGEFAFCTLASADLASCISLNPLGVFREREGLTVILPVAEAGKAGLPVGTPLRQITLTVHSSLEAVGLTAAFATALGKAGISANVVAGYYHDHIFVPARDAERALAALQALSAASRR